MTTIPRLVHLLALVVWIGGVVFFSFITAPTLFAALPRDLAGRVTAAIFPRYYLVGEVCGTVAILTAVVMELRVRASGSRSFRGAALAEILLLVLMTGLTLCAGELVLPRAAAARAVLAAPGGAGADLEQARARFDRLHRLSVMLNGAVLLLGLGALTTIAARSQGGTS